MGALRRQRLSIQKRMEQPNFWDDSEGAQNTVAQLKTVNRSLEPLEALEKGIEDLKVLAELVSEEEDPELEQELSTKSAQWARELDRFELQSMMSDPESARNVYLAIQAGAGGTESCDWAQMLLRMYTHYFDAKGYAYGMVDMVPNVEAGIKSVTLDVKGAMAYGYLRGEIGVHRLVRISPFDAAKRRHTSFASVDVLPQYEDEPEVEIAEKDIEIQFYHSSGAGGQHVNKTASAVRITHIPTGIVVACQAERSQHKNRRKAMQILLARLRRREQEKRDAELAKLYSEKGEIAWGNQIRSYVLQPYQMVKDHRTEVETSDVQGILDGDLDRFIDAYLRNRMKRNAAAAGRDKTAG